MGAVSPPPRQLASNLRGDVVQLLEDRLDGGLHHATLALVLRQPGTLLDLPQAVRQLDEMVVDCHAGTLSIWRSDAYRSDDPPGQPGRSLSPEPG